MLIYAMSDIHGEKDAFEDSLSVVDFTDPSTMLILCGDYLDRYHNRPEFLTYVMEFQESHQGQVVALMGNHEAMYIEEISEPDFAFLSEREGEGFTPYDVGSLREQDGAMLRWLHGLPFYYETDDQIFVHAGVDEEAGEYWKVGAEDYYFYSKYPQTYGSFLKDIIAGHVSTFQMCGENRVYWDGQSHFFLDGTTEKSGFVPVLKYDTETSQYTSFERIDFGGASQWSEYIVKPGGED